MNGDQLRRQLAAHGQARTAAMKRRAAETAAIAELAPQALRSGLTKVEIARLAEISRPALDAMLRDAHD